MHEARIAAPHLYAQPWEATAPVLEEPRSKQAEHDALTARWLELEDPKAVIGYVNSEHRAGN